MIKTFRNKDVEQLFNDYYIKRFSVFSKQARRKLKILHAAECISDLYSPPGNRLEKLIGDRSGIWSIRINNQWRIVFRWFENNAYEVNIVDYH